MVHDGEGNVCSKRDGNIMSPTLQGVNGMFSWSSCSRDYLRKFLVTAQSTCLDDPPKAVAEFKFPEKLPGELYNADLQCKWQFGNSAQLCMFDFGKCDGQQICHEHFDHIKSLSVQDICKGLWCHRGGRRCETKFLPAAEGTSCGPNKWCRMGQCVDYGKDGPPAVDGGWSVFSEWAPCSRTCGGGITYKERDCNNPRPQYGGTYCVGESKIYRMCNIQYRSRDMHQVPREIPREFAGYHAGVCGISCGSLRDLLREFAGSPAGFIGISRGTKSSPATPIFGGMQTPSVGPGVPTPRRHRNRTSPAAAAALADSPAPPDHVAFCRANHSAQMGTRPPAGPRIQRVESDAPPHRNTA
ncbi:metalloendopeptidase [Branchiostoma belcheri]|nr:metalloendopeptidase [Branchiostoma belcheri]